MGIEHHYEPCFTSIPESTPERWTLLRDFAARWHNLNLPLLRDPEHAAKNIEDTLNRRLPDSIREWIALSKDLIALDAFHRVFRDDFEVSRMDRFSCTTLMIQGEGDVYWAVHDKYAELSDPPVDCIHRDIETDEWIEGWRDSRTLTSFVLGHMAYFLGPKSFVRTNDIDESVVAEMEDTFPIAVDFDGLRVFEMTDLIAFVRKRSSDYSVLIVAYKDSRREAALPDCIRKLIPS